MAKTGVNKGKSVLSNIFTAGIPQTITAVLQQRDLRAATQTYWLNHCPQATLIDLKLNIPGPIKNNLALNFLFNQGRARWLQGEPALHLVVEWNCPSGNEALYWTTQEAVAAKQCAIAFEERDTLGRLFDIDVLKAPDTHLSRQDLQLPSRRCLICPRPAKQCARSRQHSIKELQLWISQLFLQEQS